jgi:hypothetical protein
MLGARAVRQLPGKPESVSFRRPQGLIDVHPQASAPSLHA